MRLQLVTPPTIQPVTVDELKTHCVIDHSLDDDYLSDVLDTAREQVEADTGRALVEQTWQLLGSAFPAEINVPKPPLVAVSSITYIDTDGEEQTLDAADYQVVTTTVGARIKPAAGACWPAVQPGHYNGVVVEFVAGYVVADGETTVGAIPHRARQALLILAADLAENREMHAPIALHELPAYARLIAGLEVGLI